MNEKMKELIAGAVARGWCSPENSHKEMDVVLAHAIGQEVEKLAESIVRECVQVLDTCHVDIAEDADLEDNNTWVNATMNTTVNFCMGRVKQHFGVEE